MHLGRVMTYSSTESLQGLIISVDISKIDSMSYLKEVYLFAASSSF
jgi:hypothetical protein